MAVSTNGHRVADEHYFAEHYGLTPSAGAGDEQRFAAAVAPLEARVHRRLNGPGRAVCVQAFVQDAERVKSCIAEVLRRLDAPGFSDMRSPLGILITMAKGDDDYREHLTPSESEAQVREVLDQRGITYPELGEPA